MNGVGGMEEVTSNDRPAGSVLPPLPLRFTGSGGEYFGIWIVNLLLTMVTLGIYSAWAKVRRITYFYRHTELAGSSFDFHGSPTKILLGRLVALAMLLVYNYCVRVRSPWTLAVMVAFAAVLPWLLRNSFRFRLYNTSWRGTRFHFRGSVGGSYRVFLLNGFLAMITLYLLWPFTHQRFKAYQHNNSYFGRSRFSFHATAGRFYLIYLLLLAAIVALFVVMGLAGVGGTLLALGRMSQRGGHVDPRAIIHSIIILYGAMILFGMLIGPLFHALLTNLIWSNTRLADHRLECRLSPWMLMWIGLSNFVLVVLTLGLYIPWASVRFAKYQVESMRLLPVSDLQEFEDAEPEKVAAIGEEAVSAFDFDIAL
jgi:uncharacterized membrane protein YjgN (DUF898 family)